MYFSKISRIFPRHFPVFFFPRHFPVFFFQDFSRPGNLFFIFQVRGNPETITLTTRIKGDICKPTGGSQSSCWGGFLKLKEAWFFKMWLEAKKFQWGLPSGRKPHWACISLVLVVIVLLLTNHTLAIRKQSPYMWLWVKWFCFPPLWTWSKLFVFMETFWLPQNMYQVSLPVYLVLKLNLSIKNIRSSGFWRHVRICLILLVFALCLDKLMTNRLLCELEFLQNLYSVHFKIRIIYCSSNKQHKKQNCAYNKRIFISNVPKWEFAFIINSSNNRQKSPTYNRWRRLQKPESTCMKILIHMAHISKNTILMQFNIIFDIYSMKQPDIYYFETIKMTSQA